MRKATGSYRTYSVLGKTAALFPEFAVKDLPSAELKPRFLRLQCRTCLLAEHSGDDGEYGNLKIPENPVLLFLKNNLKKVTI